MSVKLVKPRKSVLWENVLHYGHLDAKSRGFVKKWKSFYFILTEEGDLWQLKGQDDNRPIGRQPYVRVKGITVRPSNVVKCSIIMEDPTSGRIFRLVAEDFSVRNTWLSYFEEAGAILGDREMDFLGKKVKKKKKRELPLFALQDIRMWSETVVFKWLEFNNLQKCAKKLSGFNGMKLLELKKEKLKTLGIVGGDLECLYANILRMKRERHENMEVHSCWKKLEKLLASKDKFKKMDFRDVLIALSDISTYHEVFLPSRMEIGEDTNVKLPEKDIMLKPLVETLEDSEMEMEPEEWVNADSDVAYSSEYRYSINTRRESESVYRRRNRMRLPVKLVLSEFYRGRYDNLEHFLSTLQQLPRPTSLFKRSRERQFTLRFGILIGPFYLEWNENQFVVPRAVRMTMLSHIVSDLNTTSLLRNEDLFDVFERVASVCVRYNTMYTFAKTNVVGSQNRNGVDDNSNGDGLARSSSQFVEDVMEALLICIRREGAWGEVFQKSLKHCDVPLEFTPGKQFRDYFRLDRQGFGKEFHFKTHNELDTFMHQCCEIDEIALQMDFKEEYCLLQHFDRVFWGKTKVVLMHLVEEGVLLRIRGDLDSDISIEMNRVPGTISRTGLVWIHRRLFQPSKS